MSEFKKFKRKSISEMRPYVFGEDMIGISVSDADKNNGSPKTGDYIARNPKNHEDKWLVSEEYFNDNLEPLEEVIDNGATAEDPASIMRRECIDFATRFTCIGIDSNEANFVSVIDEIKNDVSFYYDNPNAIVSKEKLHIGNADNGSDSNTTEQPKESNDEKAK